MAIHRTKSSSYYSIGPAGEWLRLAIAAVDEAAAALCMRQWQLARVRVAVESRALAAAPGPRRSRPLDRCGSWH
jgi:hypothetical protein